MPTSRNFNLSQSVTNRDENVDDRVANLIVGGANITATYDDAAGTLTIDGQSGYTDTDVGTYLTNNGYDTATNIVATITDSAPATLDTLNELAAALGDDPNFATTTANNIALKLAITDFTSTADTWLGTKSTTDVAEGTNLYYTDARADARADTRIAAATTTDLTEGTNLYYTSARVQAESLGGSLTGTVSDATVQYGTSYSGTPAQGSFFFDSLNQKLKIYTGSAFVDAVPAGGGGGGGGGSSNANATFEKYTYSITSSTNAVSGADDNSETLSYATGGNQNVEVYVNGVKQVEGASNDYVATTGTSVTFVDNLASGDVVDIQVYELLTNDAFYLKTDTYTKTETNTQISTAVASYLPLSGGTMTGNIVGGTTNFDVMQNTSDGADNKRVRIGGGGDVIHTRGAFIELHGNEHSSTGKAIINAGNVTDGEISLRTGATERLVIAKEGNVGIANISPDTPLHVRKAGAPNAGGNRDTVETVLTLDATGYYPYTGYGVGIDFKGEDYGNSSIREYAKIEAVMTGHSNQTAAGDSAFTSALTFATNSGGASSTLATEKMRIDDSGNIGLGTNDPVDIGGNFNTFNINGIKGGVFSFSRGTNSATQQYNIYTTDDDGLHFYRGGFSNLVMQMDSDGDIGMGVAPYSNAKLTLGGTDGGGYPAVLMYDNNNSSGAEFFMLATDTNWTAGANKFIMGHGAPSSSNTDVTIDSSGNVGIGTYNPSRLLHVNSGSTNTGVRFESTDQTASIEFADNSGTAEIGATGSDLVFFPGGYEKARVYATGGMKIGEQRFREGYTSINSSETRWYKIVNYANTAMISGRVFMSANRFGGYNQTGSYREYKLSIGGYSNNIYGPSNTTGDSGEGGFGSLHIGSDNHVYLQVSASIYGGVQYFYILGYINNWQFDNTVYVTSQP